MSDLPLTAIPTEDAEAALAFCRRLAGVVGQPLPAAPPPAAPLLSVVLPIFNEQENLGTLVSRLVAALDPLELTYELIFVDDGSRDASVTQLRALAQRDSRVVLIELSRNFGHQTAVTAGLDFARGQGVIIMDSDLQDPPEALPQFIAKWRDGHDVVYAIRAGRKEGWLMRSAYAAFYRLLQRVAQVEIPLDAGDFCIMDRRVVDLLNGMPERNRFVRGIRSWVGLDQVGLVYERHGRNAGRSKYTFSRLMYLALDGLVSFSFLPLRIITVIGLTISLLAIVAAIIYTIQRITVGLYPPGFATIIVAVLFLAGIQLITTGVIGEYIGRIFDEVKRRPLYVVHRVTGETRSQRRTADRRL